MKTVILCCASLEKEVRLAMARKEISYPLHILTDNNHDVPNRCGRLFSGSWTAFRTRTGC